MRRRKFYSQEVVKFDVHLRQALICRMHELGLSIKETAARVDYSLSHWTNIVSGVNEVNWKRLPSICAGLNISVCIDDEGITIRRNGSGTKIVLTETINESGSLPMGEIKC